MNDPNIQDPNGVIRRLDKFNNIHKERMDAKTVVKPFMFSFQWTLEDFALIKRNDGQFLSSQIFSSDMGSTNIFKWRLHLYPLYSQSYIYVRLALTSGTMHEPVKFSISILNKNNEKKCTAQFTHVFGMGGENNSGSGRNIVTRAELFNPENSYLVNDALIILCEVEGYVLANSEVYPSNLNTNWQKNNFGNDLDEFLENEEFCDVTITLPDGEIKAHKLILASRSPVFKAMFLNETKERTTGHVNVEDVTLEVFKEMLTFMYTGKSPNFSVMAMDLFKASDKYALLELKEMCEKFLWLNLTVKNSIKVLKFANLYAPGSLKIKTLDFIKTHVQEVMKLEEWKFIVDKDPQMLAEIFQICMN